MTVLESPRSQALAEYRKVDEPARTSRLAPSVDSLFAAWNGGSILSDLPATHGPADIAEGHYIQDQLIGRLGRKVQGWKLAVTSDFALAKTGLEGPIYGRLFEGDIVKSPASLSSKNFHGAKMEPEFAVRLARPLGGDGITVTRAAVEQAVADVHLAIELAASRYVDSDTVGFASQIADNAGTGALILGPAVENWRETDLKAVQVSLIFDDEVVAEGFPVAERCDPMAVVTWLANELGHGGLKLNAGDVVTTGTLAQPTYCEPGTKGCARFEGIGEVRLTFA